jgi:hypothetical protein
MPTPPRSAWFAVLLFALSAAITHAHPGHDTDQERTPSAPSAGDVPTSRAATPKNEVTIKIEGDFRVIRANGWPDHEPGKFPRRGNPNALAPQNYTFRVPVKPIAAEAPVHRGGWWWGVALNGVPFEPGTAETWNNDRRSGWRYEAATGFLDLGLDEHNAHVQPNGSYHYHAYPKGLVEKLGKDGERMILIGWAADGFPLYTAWAHEQSDDAKSPLRKMRTSYRLKKGHRPTQEGGPGGNYDGRFTEDFEFVKGGGDLDELNGRTGVTPDFPGGTYYYVLSEDFPFVPRLWRGTPDESFSKGGRPGGRGGERQGPGGPPGRGPAPDRPTPPILRALDLNRNGVIDADEITKAPESLKALDVDQDGKLSPEDFQQGLEGPPR